jgi:isopropylmalate/homocitrate/citramalate synthase
MIIEHAQLKGMVPGVNYAAITELADYAHRELGFEIPRNYPLVGKDFNVTRAGIHADGLLKNEEIYNCFDTQRLLHRPIGVAIADKTGAAGIKHWVETHYEIQIPKHDPRIMSIKDKIDAEYAADRISVISDEEMHQWVRQAFNNQVPPARKV